jgi:iron complex transport system substrate-binding protein
VISLVPSGTEILFALGAGDRVVGRTDYDRGTEVVDLPSVGGGLDPSLERLAALEPDLVVGWAEAGQSSLRAQLEPLGIAVFGLRTQDTSDVYRAIQRLGRMVGRDSASVVLRSRIRAELDEIRASVAGRTRPSVAYLVEHDPPMVPGTETFITQLIGVAGGDPVFPELVQLWPQVSLEELVRRQPDVLLFPDLESLDPVIARLPGTAGWRDLRAVREGRIERLPADLMSRPGPRLGEAARAVRDRLFPPSAATTP